MRAIAVFLETIRDQAAFEAYRSRVLPTLEPFGGRFIVRGGAFTVIEGAIPQKRIVMIEFPSRAAAEGWYGSDAYQAILPMRRRAGDCDAFIIDAVD